MGRTRLWTKHFMSQNLFLHLFIKQIWIEYLHVHDIKYENSSTQGKEPELIELILQFSWVQLLCLVWLCDTMDCSMPSFPLHPLVPSMTGNPNNSIIMLKSSTEHLYFTESFNEFHCAFRAYGIFIHFSLIQYLGTFLLHYYNCLPSVNAIKIKYRL